MKGRPTGTRRWARAVQAVTVAAPFALVVAPFMTGCAPGLQAQVIGNASAVAGPTAPSRPALAVDIAVPESHSAQVLRYVVSLPRAVQLHYQVVCPSVQREGTLGETFDRYRTRRLAELERERQTQAGLIGALVGAVAPPVRAGGTVAGPGGAATVTGVIDPGAAAAQAARDALPPPSLPPGDTGASVARGTVDLGVSPAGRCALALAADPDGQDASGAQVALELVRLVDVEAEERARREAVQAQQDRQARALRLALLASLQRAGADPMARARARAAAEARAQEDSRRRAAAAEEEDRRRQAAASQAQLQRERQEEQRRERERQEAAERERREAPERARREAAERERQARLESERQARLTAEAEARARAEREAAERRAREWRVRQAGFALRWQILVRLQRLGADPGLRLRLEEARLAARRDEQRRQYEERQRREIDASVARREAFDLRFNMLARLRSMGADPDFRRRRDEEVIRAYEVEARQQEAARAEAAERVRRETQAAIDLRVLAKLRLRQLGAVDRPSCPPPPVETPPPAPFAGATWIAGRYGWNGIAWVWASGHYERPPEAGTVWVPPVQVAVSGTLVVRPGRWVRITIAPPR